MSNDRTQIELIKERLDIVNFIDSFVKLRKVGKNYSGLCPFHKENSPSFIVNPDMQGYKCFGCGKSGDAFSFLMELEGLEFVEALERLAKRTGVNLDINKPDENSKYYKIQQINEFAADFFQKALQKNEAAKKYLEERELNKNSVIEFQIGYAPGNNELLKAVKSKFPKAKDDLLVETGLFGQKKKRVYDKFINRLMFTIHNTSGKVIGFSGRQMPNDDFGPKYMNTPETPIFHKRETLFGIYQAKNNIRKKQYGILCEGQTDVISAYQIGIDNIVAPLGTGLTEQQLELIKRYTDNLLFFFDDDKAGQEALIRAYKLAAPLGFRLYASTPKPEKDIDELIKKDKDLAKQRAKAENDALTQIITNQLEKRDLTKQKDYVYVTSLVKDLIELHTDSDSQRFLIEKAERILDTKLSLKIDSNSEKQSRPTPPLLATRKPQRQTNRGFSNKEYFLLGLLLKYNLNSKVDQIKLEWLNDERVKAIVEYAKAETFSYEMLKSDSELDDKSKKLIENIDFNLDKLPIDEETNPEKVFAELMMRLESVHLNKKIMERQQQLKVAETTENEEEADKLFSELQKLTLELQKLHER